MVDISALDAFMKFVSTLGFPIFVAVWLLLRTDKLLKEIIDYLHLLAPRYRITEEGKEVQRQN